jgi:hypothetical protein
LKHKTLYPVYLAMDARDSRVQMRRRREEGYRPSQTFIAANVELLAVYGYMVQAPEDRKLCCNGQSCEESSWQPNEKLGVRYPA